MAITNRKRYTKEQKEEAVRLSSEPGRSVEQVAKELGIGLSSLQKWRSEYGTMHKKWQTLSTEQQQIRTMEREISRLRAENDFLKKTATYFASQKRKGTGE
jgi:transposase